MLAGAALVQCIGIADDDYAGFEDAVAAVHASAAEIDRLADAGDRLSARAGTLVAGWFRSLDDPALPELAAAIVRGLGDERIATPLRARAGLSALGFFETRARLEDVLWVELALRPLLADASIGARLADECHHMLVQAFYQCGAPERAQALRAQRLDVAGLPLPPIVLKVLLLDAQLAIGEGRTDAGRRRPRARRAAARAARAATGELVAPAAARACTCSKAGSAMRSSTPGCRCAWRRKAGFRNAGWASP